MNGENRASLPFIAGIMDIFIGVLTLGMVAVFALGPLIAGDIENFPAAMFLVLPGMGVGIGAIIAGALSIMRKGWGWAIAGSVVAAINPFPLGIAAVILLALSKKEFS